MSVEIKIEFERECGICYGRCAYMPGDKCERCNNTGRVPTELGRDLLEFLEHQGITTKVREGEDK
jgi:hypothetical protein